MHRFHTRTIRTNAAHLKVMQLLNVLKLCLTLSDLEFLTQRSMHQPIERGFKAMKFDRTLDFNRHKWLKTQKSAACLQDELRETAHVWTVNCARCFADKLPFNHPKQDCDTYTRDIVDAYRRRRMKNDLGKPQCFSCFMPLNMCPKFYDDESQTVRSNKADVPCAYPHVVLDTWACMWEYSRKTREVWLERIRELRGLNGNDDEGFRHYFKEMISVPGGKPIGRVAYDVNWLTQKYFLGGEPRWRELH